MEDITIIGSIEGFYCPGFSGSQEAALTWTPAAGDKGPWRGAENFGYSTSYLATCSHPAGHDLELS